MAKRREKPPEEGSPAWMATFSDLMNLLLCFFVLLFASSNMDEEKIRRIMASFNQASFSIIESGSVSLIEGQIVSGGVTQLPGIESILEYIGVSSEVEGNNQDLSATGSVNENGENDLSETDKETAENLESNNQTEETEISEQELKEEFEEQGLKQSEEMYDEISEMTESYKIDDRIVMDYNSQYVSLDLNGAVLFDAGKAEIRDDVKVFMQKIATIMSRYKECVIEIEGHTDNVPISTANFESNRYLSTARANEVYEYVMEQANLIDSNIKIAGYGESRPVASNETEEGRAKNRRVSIKIYNRLNSDIQ
ncbi:MAG: flagellar motor protein MotB [Lachnospiraceae bacterium]|nr:flagellar motor protein MotB [Lachnospiraceae bacterium]